MIGAILAATGNAETGHILLDILVVLVAAKLAAELAERVGIPTVVGEIVAGILIGPSILQLVDPGDVLGVLAELGVILLLLEVGMHMDLRELRSVGPAALRVAVIGVVLPFAGAMMLGPLFGLTSDQALFVAAALTATSVGITARVFGELKALATGEARTVLGAAVADDVIGLIILTVVVRIVTGEGAVTIASIGGVIGLALAFLVVCTAAGVLLAPKVFALIDRHARSSATLFALALAFTLGIAQLATLAKLAPIIGAFVAGMSLGRSSSAARIQRELTPVGHLFIPVFFLQIGINVDVTAFVDLSVIGLALAITAVAIVGKVAAGWGAGSLRADRLTIGLGMIPRGEVGLIFASIGLANAVFTQDLYASVLLMVLITTLITPPLLNWRTRQLRDRLIATDHIERETTPEPIGGWLVAADDQLGLVGTPSPDQLLAVALPTARSIAEGRRPSDELSSWVLGAAQESPVPWTAKSTSSLLQLLEHGTDRSWRFLEATGVLAHALPELAIALDRRRSDPAVLDPSRVLQLPTVERIRGFAQGIVDHRDERNAVKVLGRVEDRQGLLLAALLVDVCDGDLVASQAVLERLCLETSVRDSVGQLVADSGLLRAASVRPDGLAAESVLRLAVHLGDEQQADALYVLSLAIGGLESWERQLLDELRGLLLHTLTGQRHGTATGHILEHRRAEVRGLLGIPRESPVFAAALERVESAPIAYLLGTDPTEVARHIQLLAPALRKGDVRVSLETDPVTGRRTIGLAAADMLGLLARSTGVLEELGFSIQDATVATWSDGVALQSFTVTPVVAAQLPGLTGMAGEPHRANADEIRAELIAALSRPLRSAPLLDAVLRFDTTASPWHTVAELRATDRPGLLHAVAAAFAVCGVDVHAARISTADELVFDVFELTDNAGAKLSPALQDAVVGMIRSGVSGTARRTLRTYLARA
jgi:Kef-type K+ transport system membrane component KefB